MAVLMTAGLLAVTMTACSADETGSTDASTATAAAPVPVDWPTFGFDQANARFNPDERVVTADSAATLAEAWTIQAGTGMSSTPAVVDGVAHFADWDGIIHAVDAESGAEIWTSEVNSTVMSSVTIVDEAAYVADNGNVYRLDKATGEQQWAAVTSDHPLAITPSSPIVVGDHVLQAVASGELMADLEDYSFSGFLASFDTETGEEQWRVMFTPDDETGGAGVGVWSTPSVDVDRGVAYIGTGNTYEPPASTLSDSIVAVDIATGAILWSKQFTYPDVWSTGNLGGVDGDVGAGPNLWEADGRALVGAGDKRGMYHALDRETGEVVWETKLTEGSVLGGVIGTSAHGDGHLYVASNVGNAENNDPTGASQIFSLDDTTGEIAWSVEIEGAVYAPCRPCPAWCSWAAPPGSCTPSTPPPAASCGRTRLPTRWAGAQPWSTGPSTGATVSPCSVRARVLVR